MGQLKAEDLTSRHAERLAELAEPKEGWGYRFVNPPSEDALKAADEVLNITDRTFEVLPYDQGEVLLRSPSDMEEGWVIVEIEVRCTTNFVVTRRDKRGYYEEIANTVQDAVDTAEWFFRMSEARSRYV